MTFAVSIAHTTIRLRSSTVVQTEINNNSNQELRLRLQELGNAATEFVRVEQEQIERAGALQKLGFHLFDALYLACAEAGASIFLTTDDRLLRLALRTQEQLTVRVANPATWLMEVIANERNDE